MHKLTYWNTHHHSSLIALPKLPVEWGDYIDPISPVSDGPVEETTIEFGLDSDSLEGSGQV